MCVSSPDTMKMLEKTVTQFLEEGRMFTGYDVTIVTREREKIKLEHKTVRGDIHEIEALVDALDYGYDNSKGETSKWEKAQVNMGNGQWAFVFYPQGMDPQAYKPRQPNQQGQNVPNTLTQAPTAPVNSISTVNDVTTDSGGQQTDGTFSTDYRNRLLVPTRFMKEAGMEPGDEVTVLADKNVGAIFIAKNGVTVTGSMLVTVQHVERNGDIRLSTKTMKEAEIEGQKLKIEAVDVSGTKMVKVVKS